MFNILKLFWGVKISCSLAHIKAEDIYRMTTGRKGKKKEERREKKKLKKDGSFKALRC